MRKTISLIFCSFFIASFMAGCSVFLTSEQLEERRIAKIEKERIQAEKEDAATPLYPKLVMVKKIYIDDLGGKEGADLIREKLRIQLLKSPRFTIVEDRKAADAVLSGAAIISTAFQSDYKNGQGSGYTTYAAHVVLRLISTKTNEMVWITEQGVNRGYVSTGVSEKVYKRMHRDAERAEKSGTAATKPAQ